jgi:hypothetical protein
MTAAIASPTAEAIAGEILASIPSFNDDLALRTYAHLSHTPEDRARMERDGFHAHILNVVTNALALAGTPDQFEELQKAVTWYASAYLTRLNDVLSARSRTASSFITGGANFPVKRNQKALQVEANRERALELFVKSGQHEIRRRIEALETPEQKSAALVQRVCRTIDQELVSIAAIERGEMPGFEKKHFVAVITRLTRQLYRKGFLAETNAVLDHIAARQNTIEIEGLSPRHSIWKLRTDLEGAEG